MVSYRSRFADVVSKDLREEILADPDAFLASGEQIKNDKTTTVAKVIYNDKAYLVKRYNPRSRWHKVKRAFRESRASICWRASNQFLSVGLNVALPIAMVECRLGLIRGDAYFVSQWVEGIELLDWLPLQDAKTINEVGLKITELFEIFHVNRLSHGDMKATNLLWCSGKLMIVDLDSVRQHSIDFFFQRAHRKDKARFARNGKAFNRCLNR